MSNTTQSSPSTPLVVEQLLNAPVDRVWKAITDRDQMQQWYFNLKEFRAEPGFEFQFTGGPSPEKQYLHLCKITEVEVGKKLSYSWRYDGFEGESFVTFLLSPQGDNTLLTLSHAGLETFPASNPDLAIGNFVAGWNSIIGKNLPVFLGA